MTVPVRLSELGDRVYFQGWCYPFRAWANCDVCDRLSRWVCDCASCEDAERIAAALNFHCEHLMAQQGIVPRPLEGG